MSAGRKILKMIEIIFIMKNLSSVLYKLPGTNNTSVFGARGHTWVKLQ